MAHAHYTLTDVSMFILKGIAFFWGKERGNVKQEECKNKKTGRRKRRRMSMNTKHDTGMGEEVGGKW